MEAFDAAQDDVPTLFIAWTVKGFGLPFAGHKDNHSGLMNPTQAHAMRDAMGISEGDEWQPLAGVGANALPAVQALLDRSRIQRAKRDRSFGKIDIPAIAAPSGAEQATQAAFGKIMLDLSRAGGDLADRIVTTSPDVTVSTNLGAWVNQRGLFKRREMKDVFAAAKIASAQKWSATNQGQHIELGIAESNLFLMLAALGLSGDLFGERLIPVGTLYDPFIARGLDSLNYACYQDARFLLVATPSGITLGPEGGAHQSINPPLIALGQPGLRHYEPAFADELAIMMEEAFRLIDDPDGESTYLRLSTRSIAQPERADDSWKADALAGGYWLREPGPGAEAAIVAMGAVDARGARRVRRTVAPTFPASACSPSPPPTSSTAAGRRRRRRAGRASASQATSKPCSPASPPAPASSPCATPPRPRCRGSAACSASESRRSGSTASARPATSPISTPPTASTATRSPSPLPSCSSRLLNEMPFRSRP